MKSITLLLLLNTLAFSWGDDVYLKSGYVIKNALILDTVNSQIRVKMNDEIKHYDLSSIQYIDHVAYDTLYATSFEIFDRSSLLNNERKMIPNSSSGFQFDKFHYVLFGIGSAFLSWDLFITASDIQEYIDFRNSLGKNLKIEFDNSELEGRRIRKIIVGSAFVAVALLNFYFAFEGMEVNTSYQRVNFSYRF